MEQLFHYLELLEDSLWGYVGFPAILCMGLYLTFKSSASQIRLFPTVLKIFWQFARRKSAKSEESVGAVHPLQAFFASIGGCVGIGNIVAITAAIQVGGPGALFWVWVTAIVGSILKYAEVYLAILTRKTENTSPNQGTNRAATEFRGGPMYTLERAYNGRKWPGILFCLLMSVYGVEIYQFSVMTHALSASTSLPTFFVSLFLIVLVIYAERGGVKRVGTISSWLIPFFLVVYLSMGLYVLTSSLDVLPSVLQDVFHSAFNSTAATGGFVGSTLLLTISQGIRRGCYSSDIGVGYASIIHSESSVKDPHKQSALLIVEVFLDTFIICTMSVLLVLVTGVWKEPVDASQLVQMALATKFPFVNYFLPVFLLILGYSTIITYYIAGMRTAHFLSPRYGRILYTIYGALAFFSFSFISPLHSICLMSIVQFCLLVLNLSGIWRLRDQLSFAIATEVDVEQDHQKNQLLAAS